MSKVEWKTFLTEYNSELLSYEQVVEALPRQVIKNRWVGYTGASEAEIAATEKRLGSRLPPSYREFLKASNGWRFPSVWIFDLLPVRKVGWFREMNEDWVDVYAGPSAPILPVSDKDYFVYGPSQSCLHFRAEYLHAALQVSEVGDSAVLLLNPKIVTRAGEWETWFLANWLPGAIRYRSFGEWMATARRIARKRLKRLPKAKVQTYVTSRKPVSTRKAQAAARRGQTELALDSLEGFAAKGDDSAAASLAELYAFLERWDKTIVNAGRLIANPGAVYAGNVFDDMIRLLGRAGHRSGEWARIIELVEVASKANASRCAQLRRVEKRKINRDIIKNAEERNEKVFRNLIEYAERKGKPPHELLAIFGVRDYMENIMDSLSEQQRKAWLENALKDSDRLRPDLARNPRARIEHFFSLAKGVHEDEALRLYEAHGQTFEMGWQAAEYVAPVYVRRGNPTAAWTAIKSNLKNWWPLDHAQVAPLVLLTNEHLESIMTPRRCRFVLATPRGPEAAEPSP